MVSIASDEELPDGALVAIGGGEAEGRYYAFRGDGQRYLEAVDPLGFGDVPLEGGLAGEEALTTGANPHDGRDQRRVQHPVDLRAVGQRRNQMPLQRAQLRLQGSDPTVELALGEQSREVRTQVGIGEPAEVSLAAPAGPLREDREGEDLALEEQYRATALWPAWRVGSLPPVVHQGVQRDQKGV